jgi:hydrogenase expression/formation protein HypC
MCIGVPVKIVKIYGNNGIAEYGGVKRKVGLQLIEDINVGDWVILHAGFAITKLDEQQAEETLQLLKQVIFIE